MKRFKVLNSIYLKKYNQFKNFSLSGFQELVYQAVSRVPLGKVATYSQIAEIIDCPQAARAVGNALRRNPFAPQIPCHRIVRKNGLVGGFARGTLRKEKLLKKEGINIKDGRVVNLNQFLFFK